MSKAVSVTGVVVLLVGVLALLCWLAWPLLVTPSVPLPDDRPPAEAAGADARGFALLIGVDKYPNLPARYELQGAHNDVALMKQTLVERFAFDPAAITTLLDDQATGTAIRQALDDLAARVEKLPRQGPVVFVVVHYSGHGSQVPDQPDGDADQDEEDGLDETLVPSDATAQGGPEDVRDDELNRFAQRVAAHPRVHLWVVLDCCHSGTGVKAGPDVAFRQLRRAVPDHLKERKRDVGIEAGVKAAARKTLPANVVVLSACRADEEEPEFEEKGNRYGLLTFALTRVLSRTANLPKLSYVELRRAVEATYAEAGIGLAPSPQLEGHAGTLRGPVLGVGEASGRPPLWTVEAVQDKRDVARIRAGSLQGLTPGAVLDLFATVEDAQSDKPPLALLRIERVEAGQAEAAVCRWEDEGRTRMVAATLPDKFQRGLARLRQIGLAGPAMRLRVLRVEQDKETVLRPGDAAVPPSVRQGLTLPTPGGGPSWLTWVEPNDAEADLVLKIDGDYAAFFPTTGLTPPPDPKRGAARVVPASLRGGWGPIELSAPAAPGKLRDYLQRIAKARNLLRLAAELESAGSSLAVELELGTVTLDARQAIEKFQPVSLVGAAPPDLARGTLYAYRLTNRGSQAAYVTLLAVSRDMSIEIVFPYSDAGTGGEEQRLTPDKSRFTDAFEVGEPVGDRSLILVVTSDPADLEYLAQDQLPKVEKGGSPAAQQLGELLQAQVAPRAAPAHEVKGLDFRPERSEWSLRLFRWRAAP